MKNVLYIHGMNSTSKTFNHMIACAPPHEAITVDYNSALTMEYSYDHILSKIPSQTPICIVGHSLGGLLGYLIACRENDISVSHLVTISAPFGGSSQARLLRWIYPTYQVLVDISPNSPIINEMKTSKPPCKMLSLISTRGSIPFIPEHNDGIVTLRSQRSTPAKKKVDIAANHFEITQDHKALEEINQFIHAS